VEYPPSCLDDVQSFNTNATRL